MARKLGLLSIVAALLAFAAPSFASAATGLTEGGKLVPTGKTITFTNQSFALTSPRLGTITCSTGSVMLEGALTVNSLSETKVGEGGKTAGASCKSPGGGAVNFSNFRLNQLQTTGGGTGTIKFSFELELGPEAICKYTTSGAFTYNPTQTSEGGNLITLNEAPVTISPGACGSTAKLDASFLLATGGTSTPVYLM